MKVEVPVELPEGVSPLAVPESQSVGGPGLFLSSPSEVKGYAGGMYHLNAPAKRVQLAHPAPPPPPAQIDGASSTVEVTAEAPIIETTQAPIRRTTHRRYSFKLSSKLSPELMVIYNCTFPLGNPATKGCAPQPTLLKVVVTLTKTDSVIEQTLANCGFTLESGSGTKVLTGSIAPSKLTDLAGIPEVKYISLKK